MAIQETKDTKLYDALDFFKKSEIPFIKSGSLDNYCTYIRAIQFDLTNFLPNNQKILEDWILPEITNINKLNVFNLLTNVLDKFDTAFYGVQLIGKHNKTTGQYSNKDCRSALIAFTKFILGQYKADLYLALDSNDELFCKLVAQNALFCTIDVAKKVCNGVLGYYLNKEIHQKSVKRGNQYFSWFCYRYQRLKSKSGQVRQNKVSISSSQPDPEGIGYYIYDDNNFAKQAIKRAVMAGLPSWMQKSFNNFEDYMACHIWDVTCYDYRFHTSMFNIVLLPMSIGGLTDHCLAVKEILQYEAAMRFGVYPDGYGYKLSQSAQKIYNKIKHWRQPDEHNSAIDRIKNKLPQPQPLK